MSIFNFTEMPSYLRDYMAQLPKKGRGESLKIARHLRVSTTLVSQVLSGEKSFTLEQAEALCTFLGLGELESEYFMLMNLQNRAGTTSLKKYWHDKMLRVRNNAVKLVNRVKVDKILTDHQQAVFYSLPIYAALQMYTSTSKQGKTLDEICKKFELSRKKAADYMRFLVEAQLCEEQNGRFVIGIQKTHLAQGSPFLPRHHSNWRSRAILRSEDLDSEELMFTAPLSIAKKDFITLREEMASFIKKTLEKVKDSDPEEIACFNLDFFWIKK